MGIKALQVQHHLAYRPYPPRQTHFTQPIQFAPIRFEGAFTQTLRHLWRTLKNKANLANETDRFELSQEKKRTELLANFSFQETLNIFRQTPAFSEKQLDSWIQDRFFWPSEQTSTRAAIQNALATKLIIVNPNTTQLIFNPDFSQAILKKLGYDSPLRELQRQLKRFEIPFQTTQLLLQPCAPSVWKNLNVLHFNLSKTHENTYFEFLKELSNLTDVTRTNRPSERISFAEAFPELNEAIQTQFTKKKKSDSRPGFTHWCERTYQHRFSKAAYKWLQERPEWTAFGPLLQQGLITLKPHLMTEPSSSLTPLAPDLVLTPLALQFIKEFADLEQLKQHNAGYQAVFQKAEKLLETALSHGSSYGTLLKAFAAQLSTQTNTLKTKFLSQLTHPPMLSLSSLFPELAEQITKKALQRTTDHTLARTAYKPKATKPETLAIWSELTTQHWGNTTTEVTPAFFKLIPDDPTLQQIQALSEARLINVVLSEEEHQNEANTPRSQSYILGIRLTPLAQVFLKTLLVKDAEPKVQPA